MLTDNLTTLIFAIGLVALLAIEIIIIYVAIANDLKRATKKTVLLLENTVHQLTGKSSSSLLEYKPNKTTDTVHKHFNLKNIHSLDLIFDVPESQIKDVDFIDDVNPDSNESTQKKVKFGDLLTVTQREKLSYFSYTFEGYAQFLELIEKKMKWQAGLKRKVLVLTDISPERRITFSHYLTFEKSVLLDVIEPEIFWGVDICLAVTNDEIYASVRSDKVNALMKKYDEIWLFEPNQRPLHMINSLGLATAFVDSSPETEAYDH